MKDPLLPGSHFERDIILFRSTMVKPEHIGYLGNFSLADDKIIIRGTNRLNLNINLKHSDLSIFNSLAVTLRNLSSHELLVDVKLIHGICEGDEPLKSISSSGGREVLVPGPITKLSFPFECFGTYGKPSGWSNVRELEINFSHDKFFTEYENIEIEFHRIEGERRSIPQGPRLTPDGLENQLSGNIDFDETLLISNVKHGLRSRGTGVRGLGYITPFTMLDPGLYTPPPHYYSPDTSPEIISGRIMGQNLPENIPWNANPVGELEWTHFLNRHHFVRSMILEFLKTGKKFVVERVASIVSDWILKCPVPVGSNGGAGPTWESLTVAWRLREWFWIIGIMWPNPWFPNTVKNLMLRSIWEHTQSLMDHQGHPNNWIMIESCAMVLSGLLFPSFRDAAKWIETGLGRLVNEHKRQFFPDGAHFELSPLYHAICIDALLEVRRVAELTGESLPALFYKPLEQGFDYLMDLARPDFTWPSINDSGGVDRSYCQLFFNAASVFHRPDFEWVASRGSSGAPPKRKAIRLFGDAGICVIKTADKDDCQWALLRSGPAGAFHVHDDLLSIEIFDNESLWLVDPGITKYAPGILTSYYRSALAHNVLVVDGVEPLRSGRPIIERIMPSGRSIKAFEGKDFCAVRGISNEFRDSGGKTCKLNRTLILLKKKFWILLEQIVGSGLHEIVHNWQFPAHIMKIEATGQNTILAKGQSAEFVIRLAMPPATIKTDAVYGSVTPPRGWVSISGNDNPAHSVRCYTKAQLPTHFCWFIHRSCFKGDTPFYVEFGEYTERNISLAIYYQSQARETLNIPF